MRWSAKEDRSGLQDVAGIATRVSARLAKHGSMIFCKMLRLIVHKCNVTNSVLNNFGNTGIK